ncbi:MAG: primosomal protein N' [Alphaproteobacteria bacterium]|nr:primosomal protein N' [Alphaproteobacteria bacterium]
MYYNVGIVRKNISNNYIYKSDINLDIGQLVIINFNKKQTIGIILETLETSNYTGSITEITEVLQYNIPSSYIKFIKLFADYNLIPLGTALSLIVPFSIDNINKIPRKIKSIKPDKKREVILNIEQNNAVESIWNSIGKFNATLLHGITGSGKTEVFLEVVKRLILINSNAQVLILVPEIALSNSLAQSIASRCNIEVFMWHNSINITTKLYIWRKAINNEPILVVGARSALFIPFTKLKFIVVDEEHETTFKQTNTPIYHARDMAVYLASCLNIPIVLSSATPSIESYKNAIEGKYSYVKLNSRFHENAKLPSIIIHNMIGTPHKEIFSQETIDEINNYLKLKQQVLIFVNRRGYAPKKLCPKCGWKALCPACDSLLCYHSMINKLMCHRCGYEITSINKCPKCYNPYLVNIGVGIEKVYKECNKLFPDYNTIMCSSDNMNTPNKIENIINKIKNHEVDIILGTQILAKGHNFNNLNLVVITNIDYMLYSEDFRALEHTFQLLNQVSGRAGRLGNIESKVIIQSYNPEALEIYRNSNQDKFYNREINNRKLTNMPPYGYIASIEVSSKSDEEALQFTKNILKVTNNITVKDMKVIGPVKPVIYKLNYKYIYKILIMNKYPIKNYIKNLTKTIKKPNNVGLIVDLNY